MDAPGYEYQSSRRGVVGGLTPNVQPPLPSNNHAVPGQPHSHYPQAQNVTYQQQQSQQQQQQQQASSAASTVQPPSQVSARPATPRMLRSVSGTLKSKTDLNPQEPSSSTTIPSDSHSSTNSPHYSTVNPSDQHSRHPSFQSPANQPPPQHRQQTSESEQYYRPSSSNPSNAQYSKPRSSTNRVQAPVALNPGQSQTRKNELLPPAAIGSPALKQANPIEPAATPTGMSPHHPPSNKMAPPDIVTSQHESYNSSASASGHHARSQSNPQQQQQPPQKQPSQPQQSHSHHQHHTPQQQQAHQQQQFHRKSIGDWDFVKTIGAGSMGKVKLAQHNATREICAVKIIPRAAKLYQRAHANDPPPQSTQEAAQRHKEFEKEIARDKRTIREGALGRLLFHPFICRLYEMVPMTNHYYMLFEYIDGGQMLDYIVAHGSLKERHARKFARGIASALDYCHRNNVVHRDLKIENIMITEKGDIKIIDFGLSNLYSPKNLLKTYCGSLYFAAPELLSAKPYTGPEVDVWSFGVVLYVLVCGKVPFDDQSVSVLHEKIKRGNVEYPNFLSRECVSLLSRMLVVDPTKRATLYEICSHPWMNKGYDYKASNYLPKREPLKLPLDPEIIKTIAAFDLGNVQTITEELTNILTSVEYQMSCENWYKLTEQGREYASANNSHILPDPTGGFHPLISIYHLADEMRKRKRAKEEAIKAQLMQQSQSQPVSSQQLPPISAYQQQQLAQQVQAQSKVPVQAQPQVVPVTPKQPPPKRAPVTQPQQQPITPVQADKDYNIGGEVATQVAVLAEISPTKERNATTTPRLVETLQPQRHLPTSGTPKSKQQQPLPSLPIPEQAHTFNKGTPDIVLDKDSVERQGPPVIPEQQPKSPRTSLGGRPGGGDSLDPNVSKSPGTTTGINSLLRRLSSKKYKTSSASPKRTTSPPVEATNADLLKTTVVSPPTSISPQSSTTSVTKRDPMMRRGVSMKVTAKEKLMAKEKKNEVVRKGNTPATTANKVHGFIPVEYLPPLPTLDANTNTIVSDQPKAQTLTVPGAGVDAGGRKLHPTARAKSVGGHVSKDQYVSSGSTRRAHPPLPNAIGNQNSDEIVAGGTATSSENTFDGFFDDVKLDEFEVHELPQLTEDEIVEQYNNAKPGSMPSIEHCKTLFLKGFFSVQTTSTKPLPVIRYNIISILSKLGVRFQEVKGGFVCVHKPSVQTKPKSETDEGEENDSGNSTIHDEEQEGQDDDDTQNSAEKQLYGDAFKSTSSSFGDEPFKILGTSEGTKTPSRRPSIQIQTTLSPSAAPPSGSIKSHKSSNSIGSTSGSGSGSGGHRRKFSIGNSFLTQYRKKNGSQVMMPPNTPAAAKVIRGMYDDEEEFEISQAFEMDDSAESLNGYIGGSDMLVSSRIEQRATSAKTQSQHQRNASVSSTGSRKIAKKSPLKFEIHIVKVPLVGLYGVQFKKIFGNTWNYKTLASQILNEMNL